jgi:hypothetical protein
MKNGIKEDIAGILDDEIDCKIDYEFLGEFPIVTGKEKAIKKIVAYIENLKKAIIEENSMFLRE